MRLNLFYLFILIGFISCKQKEVKQPQFTSKANLDTEKKVETFNPKNIGDTLDVFNGVYVIYNQSISNTSGRHITADGYNLGLKWQCVEFVKRYYHQHLNHKMPNTYGHAKDFFNPKLRDSTFNIDRDLIQYTNKSTTKPKLNDLLIFDGNVFNPYGHVAIVSNVKDGEIEVIQQNVGKNSRDRIKLININGRWYIDDDSVLGWLRKK